MSEKYSVGCDPEVFLKLGNEYISADGLFPGTKQDPYPLEYGAVQVDGLALEFNIHPADDLIEFTRNIKTVLDQIKEMVKKVNKDFKLSFVPYAEFSQEHFDNIRSEAKILGCDPDFNMDGYPNPRPEIGDFPFRTAAGHIHIGWTKDQNVTDPSHFTDCQFIANYFYKIEQYRVSSPLAKKRLQYYGMNASFRPKPYGVELRSYSNEWVRTPEGRIKMYNHIMTNMNKLPVNY